MNDDLHLLITFYSTSKELVKVVVSIKHGYNLEPYRSYEYFREPDVEEALLDAMPLHVRTFCDRILAVETLFDVSMKGY